MGRKVNGKLGVACGICILHNFYFVFLDDIPGCNLGLLWYYIDRKGDTNVPVNPKSPNLQTEEMDKLQMIHDVIPTFKNNSL